MFASCKITILILEAHNNYRLCTHATMIKISLQTSILACEPLTSTAGEEEGGRLNAKLEVQVYPSG